MEAWLKVVQSGLAPKALLTALCLVGFVVISCNQTKSATDVTVFAAVSLAAPLEELIAEYHHHHERHISLNLAVSSALARQILDGAPADIYISAHPRWLESLKAVERVERSSRRAVAYNQVVAVVNRGWAEKTRGDVPFELVEWRRLLFSGKQRVAVGDPNFVPLGIYTKEALLHLSDWWEIERRIVPALNAYETSRLVARGEVPFGFVYASELRAQPTLRAIPEVAENYGQVVYEAMICKGAREESANEFLKWLGTEQAARIWRRHGFSEEQSRQSVSDLETSSPTEETP